MHRYMNISIKFSLGCEVMWIFFFKSTSWIKFQPCCKTYQSAAGSLFSFSQRFRACRNQSQAT